MKRVLLIPGDGIGQEVMEEAKRLFAILRQRYSLEFHLEQVDWGADRYLREGVGIPDGMLQELPHRYDALLFGALGDKRIPDMAHGRAILLGLRFGLDLFINLRPAKLLHQSLGILKNNKMIDMVIFRENTEDLYLGLGEAKHLGSEQEQTLDISKHSFFGVQRIIEAAFAYALKHGRKRVTLVDKSNAIRFGGSLWQRVFAQAAKSHPSIATNHLYVDVAAMKMVQEPELFDVIVTSNLFGDILSDLAAGITGGLGLAASANINPQTIALFEPVHGSAPDIVGQQKANPLAMFLSMAMMMNYFGYTEIASALEKAVVKLIDNGFTTPDLGGHHTTSQVTVSLSKLLP